MTPSSILDIAIGLFLVFFIVSSMASVVSEVVGMFVSRRSNTMAQFILDMFGESIEKHDNTSAFYGSTIFKLNDIGGFMGFVATAGRFFGSLLREVGIGKPPITGSEKVLAISKDNFSQAVFEFLKFTAQGTAVETFTAFNQAVNNLASSPLFAGTPIATALVSAAQQADGSVEKAATNLEKWFDGQMTTLSEYYKRRTRVILFFIGLVLAFVLNVDAIAVFQALQNNPTLREYAVQQAQNLTSAPLTVQEAPGVVPTEEPNSAEQLSTQFQTLNGKFDLLNKQLNGLGLTFGWSQGVSMDLTTTTGASKFVGILITAIAITLGAQFWFDVLKLLTGKSSSGGSSGASSG